MSEFVTQYWFSMYCNLWNIRNLTSHYVLDCSLNQGTFIKAKWHLGSNCSSSYSTLKTSIASRIQTPTGVSNVRLCRYAGTCFIYNCCCGSAFYEFVGPWIHRRCSGCRNGVGFHDHFLTCTTCQRSKYFVLFWGPLIRQLFQDFTEQHESFICTEANGCFILCWEKGKYPMYDKLEKENQPPPKTPTTPSKNSKSIGQAKTPTIPTPNSRSKEKNKSRKT